MGHQCIRGTVEPHQAQALEVHPEQLAETATVAQPPPSGPFRSGLCHAPDDQRQGCRSLPTVESQPLQKLLQLHLPHGPQPHMLHPHRARPYQLQGVHIHRLHIAAPALCRRRALHQLHGDPLRFALHGLRTSQLHQHRLRIDQLFDPRAQHRPMFRGHGEVTTQVEQGALPHPPAVALGAHQAVGEVALALVGAAGLGAADEHACRITEGGMGINRNVTIMALHHPIQIKPSINTMG